MNNNKVKILTLLGLMILPFSAMADVSGEWAGNMDTPNGPVTISFNFEEDGATLSGFSTGPDGLETAISDGVIDGDNLSFTLNVSFQGQSMSLNYTGMVAGDDINLAIDMFGQSLPLTISRVDGA